MYRPLGHACGVAVLLAALAPGAVAQSPAATKLAAAIMARLAALPDRDAAFTEQKRLASLEAPLQSSGTLVFRHPAHLEKITAVPRPERLVIDQGTLSIISPGAAPQNVALDAHPALQAMTTAIGAALAGDLPALQRVYAVDARGSLADWHMVLRPRSASLARFITTITLDGAGADLHSFALVQGNGDSQTLEIQPAR
jgi:hypothetical protein